MLNNSNADTVNIMDEKMPDQDGIMAGKLEKTLLSITHVQWRTISKHIFGNAQNKLAIIDALNFKTVNGLTLTLIRMVGVTLRAGIMHLTLNANPNKKLHITKVK